MSASRWARDVGRLAALAAVGLALVATSIDDPCDHAIPEQSVTWDLVSDCGPAGPLTVTQDGTGRDCPEGHRVQATGAEALGLPSRGNLVEAKDRSWEGGDWVAQGYFVLAGPVTIPGSSPEVTVDRVCRFDHAGAGALELVCLGPAPEARCSGTLTPAAVP